MVENRYNHSKGATITPNRHFSYQSMIYDRNVDRPLVLTTFQLKTNISLGVQSPDAIVADLPGMVKFWLEEQHAGSRSRIEVMQGEAPFLNVEPGLACEVLSLAEAGS